MKTKTKTKTETWCLKQFAKNKRQKTFLGGLTKNEIIIGTISKPVATVSRLIYGKVKKEMEMQIKKHSLCRKSNMGSQLHLGHELSSVTH